MAVYFEDNDDFSLSGLTQQGHEVDVTVISSYDKDDNYGGLLECARQLGGEISEKPTSSVEGGIPLVESLIKPLVESKSSNFLISKSVDAVPITSISVESSLSQSEESIPFYPF